MSASEPVAMVAPLLTGQGGAEGRVLRGEARRGFVLQHEGGRWVVRIWEAGSEGMWLMVRLPGTPLSLALLGLDRALFAA